MNSKELALAPSTVNSSTFGKLFSCSIDGYAYAQPLYVPNLAIPGKGTHNVIFVATEKDSVFAFDADANLNPCVPLWKTSLIPDDESQAIAFPNLVMTGTDIVPFVGITGTPVIDPGASALYVVASTQTIAINPTYSQHLYALDLATGPKIQPAGVEIASPAPQPSTFIPVLENQQPALLLANGTIYIGFGSYGGTVRWGAGLPVSRLVVWVQFCIAATDRGIQRHPHRITGWNFAERRRPFGGFERKYFCDHGRGAVRSEPGRDEL